MALAAAGTLIAEFFEHFRQAPVKDCRPSLLTLLTCNPSTLQRFELGKEIFEERVVDLSTLGMILDGQRKWIIAQAHLLDDVVISAPRFDFETVCDTIDRLMM